MENLVNILLQRNDDREDWGFGFALDQDNHIVIDRVVNGSMCSYYMSPGDAVLKVAGRSTKAMTVEKARHLILQSDNAVEIIIKKRPQGSSWSPASPSTPSFNPNKFTPAAQQNSWRPFQEPNARNSGEKVIVGSVKPDPSGGYVHTFGAPKRETSTPQTPSSNSYSNSAPRQVYQAPSYQESVTQSAPRYVQQIIIPTNEANTQYRSSPVRQNSYQNNASPFSPVQSPLVQSPQRSGQVSPVYFQPQNGYNNRSNGTPNAMSHTPRQVSRQDSVPYQNERQNSVPYQASSSPFARQNSTSYQPPARQDSWNQPVQQVTKAYSPARQDSWSSPQQQSQNAPQFSRQESITHTPHSSLGSPSYPASRQDSWSSSNQNQHSPSSRQPSGQQYIGGLFGNQNSVSQSQPEQAVRHDPVMQSSTPGLQRQSSVQYQASPKPYSPTNASQQQQPHFSPSNSVKSPQSFGPPGPFSSQLASSSPSSGAQPWQVDSFPTPPPFSPSVESAGMSWPTSSDLPSPPPPPPPPMATSVPPPPPMPTSVPPPPPMPTSVPPPPPPPPPPPMPSSAGITNEVPAWKKQIQATKEAKAASGVPQTPNTPVCGPGELPAALMGSMKKDKKPFTYLPGGLDLSEIRSPKMQRRIMANQQYAPPPPSCTGQQVMVQQALEQPQVESQFDRLNLGGQQQQQQPDNRMATAVHRAPDDLQQDPRNYGQSRSFRILQKMTGGDDEADSAPVQHQQQPRREDDEMRFTGLRRPDQPIPSRAFQQLQKMTAGAGEDAQQDYSNRGDSGQEQQPDSEGGPVDIRYRGGHIPGRSFKMLQEMTGVNDDGTPIGGPPVPSVFGNRRPQQQQQQSRNPGNLHVSIGGQPQPKQFPQPQVPASQQQSEEPPKMYTGGRIPSQSFRILQAMTGENSDDGTDM